MKLKWENSNGISSANCSDSTLCVEKESPSEHNDGAEGYRWWMDETGQSDDELYASEDEAKMAAEKFAENIARDMLKDLGF